MATSNTKSSTMSIKLLVDTKSDAVLFAEAGKEFVDFLFTLMSLPVGTVIRLLSSNDMVGSLGKVYQSIENICNTYVQPNIDKGTLLNPKIAAVHNNCGVVPLLLPKNEEVRPAAKKMYICSGLANLSNVSRSTTVSDMPASSQPASSAFSFASSQAASSLPAFSGFSFATSQPASSRPVSSQSAFSSSSSGPFSSQPVSSQSAFSAFSSSSSGAFSSQPVSSQSAFSAFSSSSSGPFSSQPAFSAFSQPASSQPASPQPASSQPATFAYGSGYANHLYVAQDPTATCPQCNNKMSVEVSFVAGNNKEGNDWTSTSCSGEGAGGFVKGVITYMVMDDLEVTPMSTISSIALLKKFNVKEVGALQEMRVSVDMDQGLKLLKASLQSKTVLTDVFLRRTAASRTITYRSMSLR